MQGRLAEAQLLVGLGHRRLQQRPEPGRQGLVVLGMLRFVLSQVPDSLQKAFQAPQLQGDDRRAGQEHGGGCGQGGEPSEDAGGGQDRQGQNAGCGNHQGRLEPLSEAAGASRHAFRLTSTGHRGVR